MGGGPGWVVEEEESGAAHLVFTPTLTVGSHSTAAPSVNSPESILVCTGAGDESQRSTLEGSAPTMQLTNQKHLPRSVHVLGPQGYSTGRPSCQLLFKADVCLLGGQETLPSPKLLLGMLPKP